MSTQHGDFLWHELATPDTEAAKSFYTKLLGWECRQVPMQTGEYSVWTKKDSEHGGMLKMEGPEWANIPPHWMLYIHVNDVDQSASEAKTLGGSVEVPPTDIPDVGRFCVIKDPTGAVLSLMTPLPRQ